MSEENKVENENVDNDGAKKVEPEAAAETPLPEDFPYREDLAGNEITTIEALNTLDNAAIGKLKKIGVKKAAVISKALTELLTPKSEKEIAREKRRAFEDSQREHYEKRMKAEKPVLQTTNTEPAQPAE